MNVHACCTYMNASQNCHSASRCHSLITWLHRKIVWLLNPLSIAPFQKFQNYIPKINRLLFLNPFDYRHNPGLFWKATLWGLLSKSQNYFKYYWNKVTLKRFSVFDWIQIIVAVAGALRSTIEQSHNTGQILFQIWGQYHQKWTFCIVFSNLCLGQKGHLETP